MKIFALILSVACFGLMNCVRGQQFAGERASLSNASAGPSNLEIELLVVQVPQALALPLIPKLSDRAQSESAVDEIHALIANNQARLIAWPVVKTKSGQRAVFEQVEEFRYATDYDPAERVTKTDSASKDLQKKSKATTTIVKEVDAIPVGFETRNVGVTLEVEPLTVDGIIIDLSLVPQHNLLLSMRRVEIEDKASGRKVIVEQPIFHTNKVTTSLSVRNGDYTLLGTFKMPKPEGYIELFILHTRIKTL